MMSYSRGSRQSSYSRCRSRSRSVDSSDIENPGNNLYVTGLSSRVTDRDLEEHFSAEGEVIDASIVLDPWTRESRGFGFVTMATLKEAERCIKYLDSSVLEGHVITVEKAKRRRGRNPTPGRYLGSKSSRGRRYSPSMSPVRRDRYSSRYSPEWEREWSHSPYSRGRSYSRYDRRQSYSPYGIRRSCSPSDRSNSPYERCRSYSPYGRRRSYSPYDRRRSYYSPHHGHRYRSRSPYRYGRRRSHSYGRSVSPYYSRRSSPRDRRGGYSPSVSPCTSYSRSCSPVSEESRSCSPRKGYDEEVKQSRSRSSGKRHSRESYAHSHPRGMFLGSAPAHLAPDGLGSNATVFCGNPGFMMLCSNLCCAHVGRAELYFVFILNIQNIGVCMLMLCCTGY